MQPPAAPAAETREVLMTDRLLTDRQYLALEALAFGRRGLLAGLAAVAATGLAGTSRAQGPVIDITRARTDPMPIAIPDFAGAQPYGAQIAIPVATGGRAWSLRDVRSGSLDMATAIATLIEDEYCTLY